MDTEQLLAWCQQQTRGYKGVSINDLDHSWKDGLALCALIHSLEGKNGKDYEAFVSLPASVVLSDTFQLAEKLGIPPLLQSSDLLDTVPNSALVESYLQFVYQHWQQHPLPSNQEQKENNGESKSEHTNGGSKEQVAETEAEADQDLALLTDHVGKTLRESKEIKGMLVNIEAELTKIHQNIEQHDKHKELVMYQISEKTLQLDTSLENERLQYDKEIEKLEKELDELKKKGPSDQQLALKRKLDEQLEKKDNLAKLKKQMEADVEQLKEQLANDERKRAELQEKRVQAEQKRGDLRQKHKEELQRLQHDLYDNLRAEDQIHTDLLQRKAVNTALTSETNRINTDVKNLDGTSTRLTKQNSDLM